MNDTRYIPFAYHLIAMERALEIFEDNPTVEWVVAESNPSPSAEDLRVKKTGALVSKRAANGLYAMWAQNRSIETVKASILQQKGIDW